VKLLECGVKDFRIIRDQRFKFTDGVNLIKGNNAQGKTTVLEAIYVFARGRSFRTRSEAEIIAFDKDGAEIDIVYEDKERVNKMSASYRRDENRKLFKNGVEIKKTSEFLGNFRAVLFTPDHLSIIKSAATDRRLFLDIALSQIEPKYIGYLKKYSLLLSQRNALLKERNADAPESLILFETLAEQMAPAAAAITALRCRYCEMLTENISEYFKNMTDGAEVTDTVYESCISSDVNVLKDVDEAARLYERKFIDNLSREINLKSSLYGIQKDDIDIKLNGYSSRKYCSQGQQRSLAIALKLAEGDISMHSTGEYPVYLLDDISGELDKKRNAFFMSQLKERQIIITSCNINGGKKFDNVITMKNGGAVK
jgi:DNA replication and repair protein RecF